VPGSPSPKHEPVSVTLGIVALTMAARSSFAPNCKNLTKALNILTGGIAMTAIINLSSTVTVSFAAIVNHLALPYGPSPLTSP
jgi:hypothetical protein